MRKLFTVLVFFAAFQAVYAQQSNISVRKLDDAARYVATDINNRVRNNNIEKAAVGVFLYNNMLSPLGNYWNAQLTHELSNIPNRAWQLFSEPSSNTDAVILGEITEISGIIRIYTRIVRTDSRAVVASSLYDFEIDEVIGRMLVTGRGVFAPADSYESDSFGNPSAFQIGQNANVQPVNRTFHSGDDKDYFLLAVGQDGILVMETSGDLDTVMEIYDADTGETVAFNDDGGSNLNAKVTLVAYSGSRLVAGIFPYDSEHTGYYGFRAYFAEDTRTPATDSGFNEAQTIDFSKPQEREFSSGDDVHYFVFQVDTAAYYTISARGVSSTRLDTYVKLYDGRRRLITEDDDGGEYYDSRLRVWLAPGSYYLRVHCLQSEPDEPYVLSVSR
jgi:hypothetical protein